MEVSKADAFVKIGDDAPTEEVDPSARAAVKKMLGEALFVSQVAASPSVGTRRGGLFAALTALASMSLGKSPRAAMPPTIDRAGLLAERS
jgi:hypothetical protein